MSVRSNHKILLTGLPGCGKTTLIRKVVDRLDVPVYGFFTNEIREAGQRVGFEIETFSEPSKKEILSHIDIKSKYRVSKYGVNIDAFERLALPELETGIRQNNLIVIDEIGKMELYSAKSKDILIELFNSQINLLATILFKPHPLCDRLKRYAGVEVINVNKNNRGRLVEDLLIHFA